MYNMENIGSSHLTFIFLIYVLLHSVTLSFPAPFIFWFVLLCTLFLHSSPQGIFLPFNPHWHLSMFPYHPCFISNFSFSVSKLYLFSSLKDSDTLLYANTFIYCSIYLSDHQTISLSIYIHFCLSLHSCLYLLIHVSDCPRIYHLFV